MSRRWRYGWIGSGWPIKACRRNLKVKLSSVSICSSNCQWPPTRRTRNRRQRRLRLGLRTGNYSSNCELQSMYLQRKIERPSNAFSFAQSSRRGSLKTQEGIGSPGISAVTVEWFLTGTPDPVRLRTLSGKPGHHDASVQTQM